jgi:endonuclease YncB( thermonuclease family)
MRRSGGRWRPSREDALALAFAIPLAACAGYVGAHRIADAERPAPRTSSLHLEGRVTHIRDGDTIEVSGVPVRIANLDCAERGTTAGDRATAAMRRIASGATAICALEGRMSYDRQVGVCSVSGVGDVGEALISSGACARW